MKKAFLPREVKKRSTKPKRKLNFYTQKTFLARFKGFIAASSHEARHRYKEKFRIEKSIRKENGYVLHIQKRFGKNLAEIAIADLVSIPT